MKNIFLILFTLIFLSGGLSYAQKYDNKTAKLKGKKVLLFTRNGKGYIHDNIPASIDMFFKLSKEEGFQLDTTTCSAIFATKDLAKYHAVVFSNTNNDVFDNQAERDGFVNFVRSGKGFVGIHSACGTERNWDWFIQMIGCTFEVHPPFQAFPVKVIDKSHPSALSVPATWNIKDELYIMRNMNPSVRILMVSDFSSPEFKLSANAKPLPNTYGKVFPCVWCNDFEGGRQWYTALGHDKGDYSNPTYVSHILGGLKWVIR